MNIRTIYCRSFIKTRTAFAAAALTGGRVFARSCAALCLAVMCASAAAQPAVDVARLEAAAQRGDVPALMTLAGIYERGENVEQDFTRSNALYCKAAARGNVDAILKLGLIYASGREMMPNEGVGALLVN